MYKIGINTIYNSFSKFIFTNSLFDVYLETSKIFWHVLNTIFDWRFLLFLEEVFTWLKMDLLKQNSVACFCLLCWVGGSRDKPVKIIYLKFIFLIVGMAGSSQYKLGPVFVVLSQVSSNGADVVSLEICFYVFR